MGEIISFQERAQAFSTANDEDEYLSDAPGAPDPFPHFQIWVSYGRALLGAHVPAAIAEAMIEVMKASPEPCSFEIYKRDASTAWIDGNVPTAVALDLGTMLAPRWGAGFAAA
jgi:hypothetical protein